MKILIGFLIASFIHNAAFASDILICETNNLIDLSHGINLGYAKVEIYEDGDLKGKIDYPSKNGRRKQHIGVVQVGDYNHDVDFKNFVELFLIDRGLTPSQVSVVGFKIEAGGDYSSAFIKVFGRKDNKYLGGKMVLFGMAVGECN